jgi:hypothetical protein
MASSKSCVSAALAAAANGIVLCRTWLAADGICNLTKMKSNRLPIDVKIGWLAGHVSGQ